MLAEPIDTLRAITLLSRHSFVRHRHMEREALQRHLRDCSAVASVIPIRRLIRPRSLDALACRWLLFRRRRPGGVKGPACARRPAEKRSAYKPSATELLADNSVPSTIKVARGAHSGLLRLTSPIPTSAAYSLRVRAQGSCIRLVRPRVTCAKPHFARSVETRWYNDPSCLRARPDPRKPGTTSSCAGLQNRKYTSIHRHGSPA